MTSRGLARLLASPKAEAIREAVIADQKRARREARARIAAEKAPPAPPTAPPAAEAAPEAPNPALGKRPP
jgi:hypothetical protein